VKSWLFPLCNAGFKTTTRLFADYRVEGQENVPASGPVIFVANHLSNLDPAIVAAACTRSPGFLAKKELFSNFLFAWLLKSYGAHPVDRGNADVKALRWAVRRLRTKNAAIMLFPEGTRDRTGAGLKRGQTGVAQIALAGNAPVVPIAITGSETLQNVMRVLKPSARLRVTLGQPFTVEVSRESRSREAMVAATDEIMVRLARLLPPNYQGYYRERLGMEIKYTFDLAEQTRAPAAVRAV
jgi:1-acyl-sn-glycerol-3-phosphate acyltransferase